MRRRILAVLAAWIGAQIGAAYLFRRQRRRYAGQRKHFLVTQGGSQLRPTADEVSDGVVSVMMGGIILDLRETELTQRPARLDILSIMGGVELLVPEDWKVQIDVQPTMAGIQDRRKGTIPPERPVDLVLSCRLVMSGLDITSEMPGRRSRRSTSP